LSIFWDEIAKRFGAKDDVVNIPGAPFIINKYIDRFQKKCLIAQLSRFKGKMALDVGTGIGRWIPYLLNASEMVVGIDISKEMIRIAKNRIRHPDVAFIIATAYAMPFRSNSFDLTLSCTCLQHITDETEHQKSLIEISRVTKGKILVLELMSNSRKVRLTHYPTLILPISDYITSFKRFGVKIINSIGVDFLPLIKLLEIFRNFLFNKFSMTIPSYGGTFKQRFLRKSYQILSVFALFFSLPFNRIIKNPCCIFTRHVLLVFEKCES
jgi:ubiquinone/menaquinone biosynthesis C-methylase UbiE